MYVLLGIRALKWKGFHRVTKRLQAPVQKVLGDGIIANRERIKNTIPTEKLGSAKKVVNE